MIVKTLVEDSSVSENFEHEHGLSLFIETLNRKILFDLGKSGLFLKNAEKMGVSISNIDTVIISHGHSDHGGGLLDFLNVNNKAKIYIHKDGFKPHFSVHPSGEIRDISLKSELSSNPQIVLTNGNLKIDDELELFSNIETKQFCSNSNKSLLMQKDSKQVEDNFEHEQNLIITEDEKCVLVAGCAHKGIVNILDKYIKIKGKAPNTAIGGFHLSRPSAGTSEPIELIDAVAQSLMKYNTQYYTCHCTGKTAFTRLSEKMHNQVQYLAAGSEIKI